MDVVGHHHKTWNADVNVVSCQIAPARRHDLAVPIKFHLSLDDIAKKRLVIVRTNGYEVGSLARVIISP